MRASPSDHPNDTSFTTTVTGRRYNHLILNNLVHPIPQIIQGNTILHPSHRDERDTKANRERFVAGIPKVTSKNMDREFMDQVLESAVRYYEAPDRFSKSLEIEKEDEKYGPTMIETCPTDDCFIWSCPMFIRHDTATRSCLK